MAAKNDLPVQDIIEWDVLNWSRLITYWQPVLEELPRDSKVLAIGERNGGLSLWLASLGFDVVCTDVVDISETAKKLHDKYSVTNRIEYKIFDIVNDNWQAEQFDIIISKSVIGGLKATRSDATTRSFEVQQKAISNIHRLLKRGGYFFSAENLQGGFIKRLVHRLRGQHGWLHLHFHKLGTMFREFSIVQIKTFGILPSYFRIGMVNRLMYFINRYLLFFLPRSSRYIAFIIAQK